ncbi:uncharacterized protein LOC112516748 isoform X3 [Cynara cardunculus var. scolymus]|uniref:uncharacterized protein LOC112516748 isoform X3 n=1 Tax=Cynara cardunculus var. scolymus TaxID=59895 RepID=UPI000D62F5BB|nr:uncharacterized protein LOC112516748 isoform X3 [Cynara cardunculus var. scolymus]
MVLVAKYEEEGSIFRKTDVVDDHDGRRLLCMGGGKDGRKIHVGDCALFKPPHDSPPFVGIIRRLIVGKEDNLNLSVNWLYRPADVKLVKGASLEAAPNEVFYSFHQDEIPAASLLHPCKVAFLRKGVELPSRISSFVCRRVYDIESKRLWWLTDQDYINSYLIQERQEEVDQLLNKTRVEMYGALQAGGHSPKPLNGPNGTTQLKSSTDNIQNSSSMPSQVKSKKREHGVHSSDSVKRERLSKADDADSAQLRPEDTLKIEIAKITDKGGLVDFEGVEKIIRLMQPETAEKKVDLACRIMLVDVISLTESFDCLGRFVQLRGLLILDEWLQEVHKGKIGDGSPKGSDKSVEEFLFALLRALDRLPVNLHALQTCNVGKSVNHLRSHKNPEILKKARSLVDTWKKRVEAEMNIIETRSGTRRGGSWPNKPMMPEVSPMGNRRIGGASEGGAKISTPQPSVLKAQQGKHNSGEAIVKSPESPSTIKPLAPVAAGTGSADVPPVTTKEEKSSSSSPSANNSHSCSSEHGKVGASCKEDAPGSTSGCINKISSGISHSRKSINVVHGSAVPGVQKEGGLGKSVDRNFVSGKGSPIRATPERGADTSFADNINNQRLIVRLPSTGPSPARTGSGGSVEDASATFGKSSLVHSEKQDHLDRRTRGKGDAPPGNNLLAMSTNSSQGKDGLVGFDDVKKGIIIPGDEHGRDGEIAERLTEASKATGSASGGTLKSTKSYEASYSSINALVESCAKFSEVNASAPVGDDVGMNLLASVAAGEMSTSDASPAGSPENKRALPEDTSPRNDAKSRQSIENGCQSEDKLKVTNGHVMMEQVSSVGCLPAQGGSQQQVLSAVNHICTDGKVASFVDSSVAGLPQNGNSVLVAPEAKPAALVADTSALLPSIESTGTGKEGDEVFQSHDGRKFSPNKLRSYHFPNLKPNNSSPLSDEDKNAGSALEKATENKRVCSDATINAKVETLLNDESASWSSEKHEDEKKLVLKVSSGSNVLLQKEHSKGSELPTTSCGYVGLGPKAEEAEDKKMGSHAEQSEKANVDPDSSVLLQTSELAQESIDKNEVVVSGGSAPSDKSPVVAVQQVRTCLKQSDVPEGDISEQPASRGDFSTISTPVSETVVKLDFDLNEVLPSDDGIQGDVEMPSNPGRFSAVHTPCSLPSAGSVMTGNRPASITVAAAAKGPFISSENLLRGKTELGWKGSAATSAFRPAEPRKVIDVPASDNKQARGFLDFDLNVGVVEDVGNSGPSGGGLDLDLNACEESPDVGHLSVGISRPAIPQLPPRSLLSGRFSNLEPNSSRDFDLNNGPGVEEIGGESIPLTRNGIQFLSAVPSMRMNNMEMGNFSWFPPSSTYPAITVPGVLPGRGEQSYPMVLGASSSQRMLSPAGTSFNPEIFRGPVLSSSPAVAFSSSTPFQFPGFPFETNFSVPSNTAAYVGPPGGGGLCFPTIPSGGYRPSPYVMSVGGGNNDNRKWGSQQQQQGQGGLDLNSSGPGGGMTERGDDSEQLKMFHQQLAGGLKRKEPVDGWDGDHRNSSYKHHPSWQ